MPRIDVWDANVVVPSKIHDCGFTKLKLGEKYKVGKELGQGGFGTVHVVEDIETGTQYACKSITKTLDVPNVSPSQQERHLENIKRETAILRKLRGTLNVVYLEDVFEDDKSVHIIMELCKGGELLHNLGKKHYSEGTVASYMRGVLRTLAQCHHHKILHRDIKPGNFMLLTEVEDSPLKAIDFGLAVFFDPKDLPLKDLGMEGTPWFMAPEMLSSQVGPEVDVWAAGVMAFQLLSGAFPFNDWNNTRNPALSLVWRSILMEQPKLTGSAWQDISDDAKDFVKTLLNKDPAKRPTAKDALLHTWLQGGGVIQRKQGKQLNASVVQRLQRFGLGNAFKRTILDMITNELLQRHVESKQIGFNEGKQGSVDPDATDVLKQGINPSLLKESQGDEDDENQDQVGTLSTMKILAEGRRRQALARSLSMQYSQSVHSGSDAYRLLIKQGHKPGHLARGPHLPSGAWVPLPPGMAHGSKAWQSSQAVMGMLPEAPQLRSLLPTDRNMADAPGAAAASGVAEPGAAAAAAPSTMGRISSVGNNPSGHALEHYALLMGMGERSVQGMRKRHSRLSLDKQLPRHLVEGMLHSEGLTPSPGQSVDVALNHQVGIATALGVTPGTADGSNRLRPLVRNGSSDMLRLLGTVQRHRQEHRKVQRLCLDTSGRGQDTFLAYTQQQQQVPEASLHEETRDVSNLSNVSLAALGQHVTMSLPAATTTNFSLNADVDKHSAAALQAAGTAYYSPQHAVFLHQNVDAGGIETLAFNEALQGATEGVSQMEVDDSSLCAGAGTEGVKSKCGIESKCGTEGVKSKCGIDGVLSPDDSLMAVERSQGSHYLVGLPSESADAFGIVQERDADCMPVEVLQHRRRGQGGYAALVGGGNKTMPPPVSTMVDMEATSAAPFESSCPPFTSFAASDASAMTLNPNSFSNPEGALLHRKPEQETAPAAANPTAGNFDGLLNVRTVHPGSAGIHASGNRAMHPEETVPASAVAPSPNKGETHSSSEVVTSGHEGEAVSCPESCKNAMTSAVMVSALSNLLASPDQLQELMEVLNSLDYDKQSELSFEKISKGLRWLGYRLEASEVETLLREVAGGTDTLSQSQFIASQVDWRSFQANHREEWLSCLRNTFEDIDVHNEGRINSETLINLLKEKLPEGEVNLAVQEILMDAAVSPEGLDFDDFCRLVREDSSDSLASVELYDARFWPQEYTPGLETIPAGSED